MTMHVALAELLYRQNRFDESLGYIQKALEDDPENAALLSFQGLCLLKTHQFSRAEQSLQKSLKCNPNHDFTHYVLANLALEQGRYATAESRIRDAIDINPIHAEYYGILGLCLLNHGRPVDEAAEAAKTGLAFDPRNDTCNNVLAMAELKRGKRKLAGDILDLHLESAPGNSLSWANRAWNHLHTGNFNQAETLFERALRMEPQNEWARTGLVYALKSRLPGYRYLLKNFLTLSRMTRWKRVGILFGLYSALVLGAYLEHPLGRAALWLLAAYAGVVYLGWMGESLATLVLSWTRKGRQVLKTREVQAARILAVCFGLAVGLAAGYFLLGYPVLLTASLGLFLLTIPLNASFQGKFPAGKKPVLALTWALCAGIIALLSLPYFLSEEILGGLLPLVTHGLLAAVMVFCLIVLMLRR